jgi:hypothetical protein
MTRADSSLGLLGRSRDTVESVPPAFPSPAPLPLPAHARVILRVWGYTSRDAQWAEEAGRAAARSRRLEVAEVVPTVGGVTPIRPRDPVALAQGADFDRAWAAYSVATVAAS